MSYAEEGDYKTKCWPCKGSGVDTRSAFIRLLTSNDFKWPKNEVCTHCNGKGWQPGFDEQIPEVR